MPRWRLTTWVFLIFNVVMVGVVLSAAHSQSPMGGFFAALYGMILVVVWLIWLVVIIVRVPGVGASPSRRAATDTGDDSAI